ncbi:MAG: DUF3426 domain-containing protein [Cellvibrionaceae bacterium]
MTDMITRCPSCDTSFRITQAQLQTAKGAVRCGACLHIFKAASHLVNDEENTKNKAGTKAGTKATPPNAATAKQASKRPSPEHQAPSTQGAHKQNKTPSKKSYKESPKFEYHKPDVPSPLIALLDGESPETQTKAETPASPEIKTPIKPDTSTLKPDTTDLIHFEDVETDAKNQTPDAPAQPKAKISNKETIQQPTEVLEFDQNAIDNDDIVLKELPEDDILISDDLPLDGDDDEQQSGAYGDDLVESFLDLDTWKPKETSLFDRDSTPKKSEFDDEGGKSPDESWAIDLLSRDEDEEQPEESSYKIIKPEDRQKPSRQEQEEQFFADDNDYGKNDFIDDEYSPSSTGSFQATDESFENMSADNLGESLSENTNKGDKGSNDYSGFDLEAYNASESSDTHPSNKNSSANVDDADEEYSENFSDSFEPREGYDNNNHDSNDNDYDDDGYGSDYESDYDGSYSDQPDRKSILKGITPAPVEFHYKGNNSNWIRRSGWTLAIIAGLAGLVGQIAWKEFDTLSRKQPYRDMYITACPVIGCKVPPIAVPGMIKTTNFLVREHPTEENALMVDTILLNTAAFEQPFPNLTLTFTDIKGETVASRSFSPQEYLGGELAGAANIPSNQPVHLALEIVNPGPEAINYSAHIPQ